VFLAPPSISGISQAQALAPPSCQRGRAGPMAFDPGATPRGCNGGHRAGAGPKASDLGRRSGRSEPGAEAQVSTVRSAGLPGWPAHQAGWPRARQGAAGAGQPACGGWRHGKTAGRGEPPGPAKPGRAPKMAPPLQVALGHAPAVGGPKLDTRARRPAVGGQPQVEVPMVSRSAGLIQADRAAQLFQSQQGQAGTLLFDRPEGQAGPFSRPTRSTQGPAGGQGRGSGGPGAMPRPVAACSAFQAACLGARKPSLHPRGEIRSRRRVRLAAPGVSSGAFSSNRRTGSTGSAPSRLWPAVSISQRSAKGQRLGATAGRLIGCTDPILTGFAISTRALAGNRVGRAAEGFHAAQVMEAAAGARFDRFAGGRAPGRAAAGQLTPVPAALVRNRAAMGWASPAQPVRPMPWQAVRPTPPTGPSGTKRPKLGQQQTTASACLQHRCRQRCGRASAPSRAPPPAPSWPGRATQEPVASGGHNRRSPLPQGPAAPVRHGLPGLPGPAVAGPACIGVSAAMGAGSWP